MRWPFSSAACFTKKSATRLFLCAARVHACPVRSGFLAGENSRCRNRAGTGEKFSASEGNSISSARVKNFRRLAWLANPFAYIAINTLIAVLPGIAAKFQLSTSLAGLFALSGVLRAWLRSSRSGAGWRGITNFRWLAGVVRAAHRVLRDDSARAQILGGAGGAGVFRCWRSD
jgi:hypothetical protein